MVLLWRWRTNVSGSSANKAAKNRQFRCDLNILVDWWCDCGCEAGTVAMGWETMLLIVQGIFATVLFCNSVEVLLLMERAVNMMYAILRGNGSVTMDKPFDLFPFMPSNFANGQRSLLVVWLAVGETGVTVQLDFFLCLFRSCDWECKLFSAIGKGQSYKVNTQLFHGPNSIASWDTSLTLRLLVLRVDLRPEERIPYILYIYFLNNRNTLVLQSLSIDFF